MMHQDAFSPGFGRSDFARRILLLLSLPLLALAGCGVGSDAPPANRAATESGVPVNRLTTTAFAESLGVDFAAMTLVEEGLYYRDTLPGEGEEAVTGKVVAMHYTGYFPDGRVFDSSLNRGEPLRVHLGQREVIRGWELGIPGMRLGGHRLLVIPPGLGYGVRGTDGIPPNSVLVFDVELVAVIDPPEEEP